MKKMTTDRIFLQLYQKHAYSHPQLYTQQFVEQFKAAEPEADQTARWQKFMAWRDTMNKKLPPKPVKKFSYLGLDKEKSPIILIRSKQFSEKNNEALQGQILEILGFAEAEIAKEGVGNNVVLVFDRQGQNSLNKGLLLSLISLLDSAKGYYPGIVRLVYIVEGGFIIRAAISSAKLVMGSAMPQIKIVKTLGTALSQLGAEPSATL